MDDYTELTVEQFQQAIKFSNNLPLPLTHRFGCPRNHADSAECICTKIDLRDSIICIRNLEDQIKTLAEQIEKAQKYIDYNDLRSDYQTVTEMRRALEQNYAKLGF